MTNLEKGRAQSLWFVKKSSPKFINFEMTVGGGDRVEKGDTWQSEKQMLDTFGPQELERNIASGRVLWREDPLTKDIWQYKDQGRHCANNLCEQAQNCKETARVCC